jgi:hypothetical protein
MNIINWKIALHPMNWATIIAMLLLAGVGAHLLLEYLGHTPDTEATANASAYTEQPAGQSPGQDAAGAIDPQGSLQGY